MTNKTTLKQAETIRARPLRKFSLSILNVANSTQYFRFLHQAELGETAYRTQSKGKPLFTDYLANLLRSV
tara:strand:- start:25777 stop:25986 length:210 start_codon:yes stop_codon:yes gene_type:complete